eukprot:1594057-Amphidinium_carterae.1
MGMCLAMSKGRACNRPVNRLLRRWSAMCLASFVRCRVRWVVSELNPSDRDSQRAEHVTAQSTPHWRPRHRAWCELQEGGAPNAEQRSAPGAEDYHEGLQWWALPTRGGIGVPTYPARLRAEEAGYTVGHGTKLFAAVQYIYGHLHLPLLRAKRALQGWRRLAPEKQRRPVPFAAL